MPVPIQLQWLPIFRPVNVLLRETCDGAGEDGRLVEVDGLLRWRHQGVQRAPHGQIDLDSLGACCVVHDAHIDARIFYQELLKDQNFQVVLDPRTGQDLPQTYALDFKPSVYVSIENMNIRIIWLVTVCWGAI